MAWLFDGDIPVPKIVTEALPVAAIDGEVVIGGLPNSCLTPGAARETAERLIAAADDAQIWGGQNMIRIIR